MSNDHNRNHYERVSEGSNGRDGSREPDALPSEDLQDEERDETVVSRPGTPVSEFTSLLPALDDCRFSANGGLPVDLNFDQYLDSLGLQGSPASPAQIIDVALAILGADSTMLDDASEGPERQ
ncbi:MAG: hypothetical protein SGILL_009482 [Bacillariaceae sp.]